MSQATHTGGTGAQASARAYQGWQVEKINFMFGLSTQRALMLGAAVLIATMPIAMSHTSGIVVAWPVSLVLALLVFVRIAGRTTDEWAMAVVSYAALRTRNQHKFLGAAFSPLSKGGKATSIPDLPGFLAPVRILVADMGNGRELAVAYNRHEQSYTAVAKVRFPGIGLVDSGRRDQRVAGWGSLISGLCTEGNPITRVQALQRLVPESGAELRRWHEDHISNDAPILALEVSQQLLGAATVSTSNREAYLAFTLDARRAAHAIKTAGGGPAAAASVLARHMRAVAGSVTSADLMIDEWLTPATWPRSSAPPTTRTRCATSRSGGPQRSRRRRLARTSTGFLRVVPALAGPAAAQANAGTYAHDGATSVTYWVYNWPKHQVPATCLAPLLGEGEHRRSFSIHIEPLSPRIAERDVMRERTARSVAVRMRERTGQIVPEHEKDALLRANEQDAERSAGHGLARFTGYVTVTVTDPEQLPDACAALEADAAAARIELRRMWFAQDIGFALSCLPLGFGLPRKRW
ncbi:SCO6880 family protein [Catenulispora yoronensis]